LVLAHRQAGPRLGVLRDGRHDLTGAQPAQRLEPGTDRLRPVQFEQHLTQVVVDGDRRVGGGVDAAGDPALDLPERDLVRDQDRRLQAGSASLLYVVGRRRGRQARAEHRLPGQVEVPAVLEHRARGDLAQALVLQPEPGDHAVEGGGEHVLVGRPGVRTVGAGERDPVTADDGGPANGWRHGDPSALVLVTQSIRYRG
jgi:hypothetical protein